MTVLFCVTKKMFSCIIVKRLIINGLTIGGDFEEWIIYFAV